MDQNYDKKKLTAKTKFAVFSKRSYAGVWSLIFYRDFPHGSSIVVSEGHYVIVRGSKCKVGVTFINDGAASAFRSTPANSCWQSLMTLTQQRALLILLLWSP